MAALRELLRCAAGGRNHPDIGGIAVGIHVRRGHGVDDPFPVRRNLRLGDAMHFDHVVEGDGMFRFLGRDFKSARQNQSSYGGTSQKNTFHSFSPSEIASVKVLQNFG